MQRRRKHTLRSLDRRSRCPSVYRTRSALYGGLPARFCPPTVSLLLSSMEDTTAPAWTSAWFLVVRCLLLERACAGSFAGECPDCRCFRCSSDRRQGRSARIQALCVPLAGRQLAAPGTHQGGQLPREPGRCNRPACPACVVYGCAKSKVKQRFLYLRCPFGCPFTDSGPPFLWQGLMQNCCKNCCRKNASKPLFAKELCLAYQTNNGEQSPPLSSPTLVVRIKDSRYLLSSASPSASARPAGGQWRRNPSPASSLARCRWCWPR